MGRPLVTRREFEERCGRDGVASFEEFEKLIEEHPERQTDLVEDFQQVDLLTYRTRFIPGWLKSLE